MADQQIPTLFDWAGGMQAFERLTTLFYQRVGEDPLLAPVFASMDAEHAMHVAHFIAEVFGGPTLYSGHRHGHAGMVTRHMNRHLTEAQRSRWVQLICACADDAGLPADPEFRSAFVAYLEWGSRIAVINSQSAGDVTADQPMPRWGWGEVKGPYQDGG